MPPAVIMLTNVMHQFAGNWDLSVIFTLMMIGVVWVRGYWSSSSKGLLSNVSMIFPTSGLSAALICVFVFVLCFNLLGLLPFGFSVTSQAWCSISLALSLVITSVGVYLGRGALSFFVHFVPSGSPVPLGIFLFWMEILSTVIRPITLVLRLCANMTAGHVMLALISSSFVSLVLNCSYLGLFVLVIGVVFFMFELFVAFIQSLVFSLLLSNYFEESY